MLIVDQQKLTWKEGRTLTFYAKLKHRRQQVQQKHHKQFATAAPEPCLLWVDKQLSNQNVSTPNTDADKTNS